MLLRLMAVVTAVTGLALAQSNVGEISGQVSDSTGGAVPNTGGNSMTAILAVQLHLSLAREHVRKAVGC